MLVDRNILIKTLLSKNPKDKKLKGKELYKRNTYNIYTLRYIEIKGEFLLYIFIL